LALSSSLSQDFATLDLKEASDRVSVDLVRHLFGNNQDVLQCLLATRTTATKLPDGSELSLNKFAPMGSALCFPVEALCFWAISVAAVMRRLRLPRQEVGNRIFVYGDDIIVPTDWAPIVVSALEQCCLKVNKAKCCATGQFRESCGMDAFKGVCVTPTRLKKLWVKSRNGGTYAAYCAFANQMAERGYTACAEIVWQLASTVYGFIPYGLSTSPFPCKIVSTFTLARALNRGRVKMRWNTDFQRSEVLVLTLKSVKQDSILDGWARALRNLVSPKLDEPSRVVLPSSTQIKRRWSSF
jgi:hypothetical protein